MDRRNRRPRLHRPSADPNQLPTCRRSPPVLQHFTTHSSTTLTCSHPKNNLRPLLILSPRKAHLLPSSAPLLPSHRVCLRTMAIRLRATLAASPVTRLRNRSRFFQANLLLDPQSSSTTFSLFDPPAWTESLQGTSIAHPLSLRFLHSRSRRLGALWEHSFTGQA